MRVRPFYIETNIEGRQNLLSGGPKSSSGTMRTRVLQRDKGEILPLLAINTFSEVIEGARMLTTEVIDMETNEIIYCKTTDY